MQAKRKTTNNIFVNQWGLSRYRLRLHQAGAGLLVITIGHDLPNRLLFPVTQALTVQHFSQVPVHIQAFRARLHHLLESFHQLDTINLIDVFPKRLFRKRLIRMVFTTLNVLLMGRTQRRFQDSVLNHAKSEFV
ncbi:MAG: hypothetical protein GY801_39615 [bacterium]|nr:hypothetical protein [bacterium]